MVDIEIEPFGPHDGAGHIWTIYLNGHPVAQSPGFHSTRRAAIEEAEKVKLAFDAITMEDIPEIKEDSYAPSI